MLTKLKTQEKVVGAKQVKRALSKSEVEAITQGTVLDWMYESRLLCEDIYKNTSVGKKLSYDYMYKYMDTARFQLQKGGIRLASILNEIFG